MHIKMPEFPKAEDALSSSPFEEGVFDLNANLEGFWCDGFVCLGRDTETSDFYVEAKLFVDDCLIVSSGQIFCNHDKKSIIHSYNVAIKSLKARYTEWVYENILDNVISVPTAESK